MGVKQAGVTGPKAVEGGHGAGDAKPAAQGPAADKRSELEAMCGGGSLFSRGQAGRAGGCPLHPTPHAPHSRRTDALCIGCPQTLGCAPGPSQVCCFRGRGLSGEDSRQDERGAWSHGQPPGSPTRVGRVLGGGLVLAALLEGALCAEAPAEGSPHQGRQEGCALRGAGEALPRQPLTSGPSCAENRGAQNNSRPPPSSSRPRCCSECWKQRGRHLLSPAATPPEEGASQQPCFLSEPGGRQPRRFRARAQATCLLRGGAGVSPHQPSVLLPTWGRLV